MLPKKRMDIRYMKERMFRRWYGILAGLAVFVIAVIMLLDWQDEVRKMEALSAEDKRQAETDAENYLEDFSTDMQIISVQTARLRWVIKTAPDIAQVDSGIDVLRRQEIAAEYDLLCLTDNRFAGIGVVFPYRNIGVIQSMWISAERALKVLGLSTDTDAFMEELKSVKKMEDIWYYTTENRSGRAVVACALENVKKPRAYVVYFVHVGQLISQFEEVMHSESLIGYRWSRENGEILGEKNASGNERIELTDGSTGWTLELFFDSSLTAFGYWDRLRAVLTVFLLASIGLCLAVYLAMRFLYRPLSVLLSRMRKETPDGAAKDSYRLIESYIAGIDDADRMKKRIRLVNDVLQGAFAPEKYGEDILRLGIRMMDGMWYQVYLLDVLTDEFLTHLEAGLAGMRGENPCFQEEIVRMHSGSAIVLLQFSEQKDAAQINERIKRQARRIPEWQAGAHWHMGMIVRDVAGITLSYHYALNRRATRSGEDGERFLYYYPIEWEKRFMDALSGGNADAAVHILDEIRRENDRRIEGGQARPEGVYMLQCRIEETIVRFMNEEKIPSRAPYFQMDALSAADSLEDCWIYIENACMTICSIVNRQSAQPTDSMSEAILSYVEQNYADQQMSLNLLSDRFDVSINMVNQIFKLATGNTFYVYLTRIRMEQAARKLRETDDSIVLIAEQTGYASMLSFRRAFARHMGVTPKMYRDASAGRNPQTATGEDEEE